jgi:hypothetical protein
MDMKQQILAQFDKVDQLFLPILSVDGISCEVSLKKQDSKEVFYLMITTNKVMCCCFDDMCEHVYFSEKIDIDFLKQTLASLKFNRMTSTFTSKPIMDWSFLESETVKLKYDKCCVCFETTTVKTDCGHTLCHPCYDKIKMDEEGSTLCPLCRSDCRY